MLPIGSRAPAFTLPDSTGRARSLKEFLRDGPLILYFYPADFTPGCTREACSLRDLHDDILRAGLQVVGVSPQSAESHVRFSAEHHLPFALLSDEDKAVIKRYDVDGRLGIGVRRATFLIGASGKIEDAVLADIFVSRHEDFVRKALRLCQKDVPARKSTASPRKKAGSARKRTKEESGRAKRAGSRRP
jgi:thioredoxin-dependent peroxiredoxin